jgi:hypothetical protein
MNFPHLAAGSLVVLASLLATTSALAADDPPQLGVAVDGKVEVGASASATADAAAADRDDGDDVDSDHEADDAQAGPVRRDRVKRASPRLPRVRGGAGLGVLGAFDDGGSGSLLTLEGRLGAQLTSYFGLYAQLGLHGGDMDQRGGLEGRAGYATFAVIAELHPIDQLAIGLGPVAMAGFRDDDQSGGRYADHYDFVRQRYGGLRDPYEDEVVSRYGLMLRVSPAIGDERASGRIHAFRPSFEIAVLGTGRDVISPEEPIMVLAGVSLNWDTW